MKMISRDDDDKKDHSMAQEDGMKATSTTTPQEEFITLVEDDGFKNKESKEDDILKIGVKEDDLINCWGTNSDQEDFNELVTGFDLDPDNKVGVTNLLESGNQIGGGQTEGNSSYDTPGSTTGRSNREPIYETSIRRGN